MQRSIRFPRPIAAAAAAAMFAACGDKPTETRPAASLSFEVQPTNSVAGAAIAPQVRVRVLDASGGTFTGPMTVTVTLTSASGAVLLGTKSAPTVSGVATFGDLRVEKAGGGYVLNASAGTLTAGTSNPFEVTHAAAAKLRFAEQPTQAVAGKPLAPPVTVEITDQYDNRATNATHEVTIEPGSSEPGLAVAGRVKVAAVAGVATFSEVALNRAGAYTLRAVATGLAAAASASIAVERSPVSRYCPAEASATAPFSNFNDAIAATAPGGTIAICDGTHELRAVIDRALTIMAEHERMATITNRPNSAAFLVTGVRLGTVQLSGLSFDVAGPAAVEVSGMYDTVIVENSRFRAVDPAASAITIRQTTGPAPAPVVFVRGNTATGFHQAIVAIGGSAHVTANRVEASSFHGIVFGGGVKGTIRGNRVTSCGSETCIYAAGGAPGSIEVLDNVMESDVARRTAYGLMVIGGVVARRNRIVGIGGTGPQFPFAAESFAFRQVGIFVSGPGEAAAVIEGNEITNALNGVTVLATGSHRPSVRNNRISRVGWAFAIGSNVAADFERNDVSEFVGLASTSNPVGASSFRCNWWGRAIGPWGVGVLSIHVPLAQWQPFSVAPIAGRPEVACDPAGVQPPTRFCPPEFAGGTGWRDMRDAVFTTAPGGTILVCDGTHGTDGANVDRPLTIAGEHAGAATLRMASGIVFRVWGTPGTYTIRDLGFVVDNGTAVSLGKNSIDPEKTGYDRVVIEKNRFTATAPRGRGVGIDGPSDVAGARVIVRGNVFIGGMHGVDARGAGAVDIVDNTFNDQVIPSGFLESTSISMTFGGPYAVQKNVVNGCPDRCIQAVFTTADISDNVVKASTTRPSFVGIELADTKATVSRNTVLGEGTVTERQSSRYAFTRTGIYVGGQGSSVTLVGNSITNAVTGIESQSAPVTGSDNRVTLVWWAVWATTAGPTLHRNDFTDYVVAMGISGGPPAGFLSCNYWGSESGPPASPNPAYHTPHSPVPIANKPEVKCP